MGIIIGKFRKKKSTYEILEKIENEIISIEEFRKNTEQTQKKIVGRFLIFAFFVYLAIVVCLYLYYNKFSTNQRFLCIIPLIVLPFMIYFIKRILTWYYNRIIRKKQTKLVSLKDEKKKMLDKVMETETYKVAKTILDKFGTEIKKPISTELTPMRGNISSIPSTLRTNTTGLRQRTVGPPQLRGRASFGMPVTPLARTPMTQSAPSTSKDIMLKPQGGLVRVSPVREGSDIPGPPLPLARSILSRDRSVLDKMVDYLVGDGPSNRYALICRQCSSHNGMALKEEFEYLSFRCCYCSAFNPARKKKPSAPKLEFESSSTKKKFSDSSDSDKNSSSDSDSESKPIITELRSDSPGKMSDFDKLSDFELKNSDTESSPMDVDPPTSSENITTAKQNTETEDDRQLPTGDHSNNANEDSPLKD